MKKHKAKSLEAKLNSRIRALARAFRKLAHRPKQHHRTRK